jgi:hypothetical protein
MPGLLEDLDTLRSCLIPREKARLRQELLLKCWSYDDQLQSWAGFISPIAAADGLGLAYQPPPEAEPITQEQLASAHGLSLYWTTCLLLYSTLRLAYGIFKADGLPERANPYPYIRNIANVVHVLLRPSAGMYGQHIAVFPMGIALQFAMTDKAMIGEQEMLVRNFEGRRGQAVNGFLLSVSCYGGRHEPRSGRLDGVESIATRARSWVGTRM